MSKENNLNDFLTDVGSAIKEKRGTGNPINAQNFSTEIRAIEPLLDTLSISENGEHDVKNYKKVNVGIQPLGDEVLIDLIEGDLTELAIPYGITKLREYAFSYSAIKNVTIPETVTKINNNAFYWCTSLTKITIPNSVTDVGYNTFQYCTYLQNITLPNNITYLGDNIFKDCTALTEITIPDSVINLGGNCFEGCTKLQKVILPKNLQKIMSYTFKKCTSLTEITIPSSITNFGYNIFDSCTSLKKVILQNGITLLGQSMFNQCTSLTEIAIPEGITQIPSGCFSGCTTLTEITIPSSVTKINSYSLTIGSSTNKSTIIIKSTTPPTLISGAINKDNTERIFVEIGCRLTFIGATNWSGLADIIYERNNVMVNVPSSLLNNENYTYSLDNGVTYNQFTSTTLPLNDVATIKMKSLTADTTILIGTTQGGNDVGTIANSELTFSFSGDTTIYLTIQ